VASPRSLKLDEGTLARSHLIEVVVVELDGSGRGHGGGDCANDSCNSGELFDERRRETRVELVIAF
jgi:hypothetical protein